MLRILEGRETQALWTQLLGGGQLCLVPSALVQWCFFVKQN